MYAYENKVVCFLDILGFKEIINETSTNNDRLRQVQDALAFLENYKYEMDKHNSYINSNKQITQFSDSLIISFPILNDGQLITTMSEILYIIINLINHGFLVRGGITYGQIVHTNNFVFGPAFIEAYELELSASSPRVVLSSTFNNMLFKAPSEEAKDMKGFLEQDIDGFFYIDYFKNIDEHDNYYEYFVYFSLLQNIIMTGLLHTTVNIKMKYEWMRFKYNEVVYNLQNNNQSGLEYDLQMYIKSLSQI